MSRRIWPVLIVASENSSHVKYSDLNSELDEFLGKLYDICDITFVIVIQLKNSHLTLNSSLKISFETSLK